MKITSYMTLPDFVLFLTILLASGALFVLTPRWVSARGTDIEIYAGDKLYGKYSLNENKSIQVPGPLGVTTVTVEGNRARITASPCKNQTCRHMGEFGSEGGALICVPNEVVVRVGKGLPEGVDAVSR